MDWEFGLIAPLAFRDGAEGNAHWSYCATNARRSPRAAGAAPLPVVRGGAFGFRPATAAPAAPIQNDSSLSQGRRRPFAGTLGLVKRRSSRRVQANGERS